MSIEIVIALITSIASPVLTIWLTHKLKKSQDTIEARKELEKEQPTIQSQLRDELRKELDRQRARTEKVEDDLDELTEERDAMVDKLSEWKQSFYYVRDEKIKIEYELMQVRKELEQLKSQMILLQQAKEQVNGIADRD